MYLFDVRQQTYCFATVANNINDDDINDDDDDDNV